MSNGSLFNFFGISDENAHDVPTAGTPKVEPKIETGMDRLKRMFSLDEYGYQSKELALIIQNSMCALIGGGCIGAVIQSRQAYVTFLENNQATKYLNHMEAKRELQRIMYLAFAKGAYRWGWRIGGFSFSFTSMMTMATVYFGKESLLDYVIAGGLTGALCRANLGIKGMISGCFVGTCVGTFGGGVSMLVLKASGKSMDDLREFAQTMKVTRDEALREKIKNYMLQEHTDFDDSTINDEGFKDLKVEEDKKA